MKQPMRVLTTQTTVEWYTPHFIIERARAALGGTIDLDPASHAVPQTWISADTYYTAAENGLARPWSGRVFLNPPFDATSTWVQRLALAHQSNSVTAAVLLVNSAPGYVWWEHLWRTQSTVLLRNRLRFVREDGTQKGQAKKGQTVAYFGPHQHLFFAAFSDLGRCILPE